MAKNKVSFRKCPFCNVPPMEILFHNELAFAINDGFPVSQGHMLIVPFRHIASYWELTEREIEASLSLLRQSRDYVDQQFQPSGYNIGVNIGEHDGQTVPHTHIHLIPRYAGDVEDPIGGVRNTIPGKANYLK